MAVGLKSHGRICQDSPAFHLLSKYRILEANEARLVSVERVSKALRHMFLEGQAYTGDMSLHGDTLMHVRPQPRTVTVKNSADKLKYVLRWIFNHAIRFESDSHVVEACVGMVQMLVELGAPINEVNRDIGYVAMILLKMAIKSC